MTEGPTRLDVIGIQTSEMARPVLVARRPEDIQDPGQEHGLQFLATVLVGKPQRHGVIRRTPRTLADLRELLSTAKLDLLDQLTSRLKEWRENTEFLDRKPILLAVLPKLRELGGAVEATDVFAFWITGETIATLGEKLGLWKMQDNCAAMLIPSEAPNPDAVEVICLHPVSELSMETVAQAASRTPDSRNFVAIGQGALGSQVVSNLLRTGFGSWILVDNDLLLPHNLARHALLGRVWGFPKAECMAAALTNTVQDSPTRALVCDVLDPGDKAEDLAASLDKAEIVFDFSASTAVARHLASDTSSNARRVSLFLNPSGRHLVLLAEDINRGVRLDELEAQFYRLVVRTEALRGFFQERPASLRYGGSCADISMHIPQDRVALHAGIAAGALQQLQAGATISVWHLTDDLSVDHFRVKGSRCCWFHNAGWKVGIDTDLVTHLLSLRSQHLPSETGGILVGTVDAHRKWVLLVDVVPAPPDSEQWPTGFIRGSVGLCREVKKIQEWTGHIVHYVGEWHSHPPGKSLGMSSDDRHVLDYVAKYMRVDGLPGLILIVGETGVQCHINVSLNDGP
ncbi:MAG: ThiF family adenylyltransferase [Truepera sp.]|nr:ThiF family adenylyltransferase [Truepera sp.]